MTMKNLNYCFYYNCEKDDNKENEIEDRHYVGEFDQF